MLWRSVATPVARRALSTAAAEGASSSSWGSWVERRKDGLIKVLLTGSLMCTAMHAVNLRNRADEAEAEMMEQLRAASAARHALLIRAPALAREMGLPAKAEGKFKAALQQINMQAEDTASAPMVGAPVDATPAAVPAGGGAQKQQAVW